MQKQLRIWTGVVFSLMISFLAVTTVSSAPASSFSPALRRYPYLTDAVGSYTTINWATDRSESSGAVRYGKVGSEACTAHYAAGTKTAISINGVLAYQWKAQLDLLPATQYCYRVYLGTSPSGEIDLLGSDASPSFQTQVPSGAGGAFSFIVIGDWGQVDSSGTNPSQASLMSLIASSGARFAVTTGDNGYPSGSQANYGDLLQTGANISAVFGPSFWKVPGASLPLFLTQGNHGISSSDANHPALLTWPEDRAVSTSRGRYVRETYCCVDGTTSASYPSAWYAFDAGPARFYVLQAAWSDTNIGTASDYQVDYDYHWAPGTPQYQWLQADLAAHPSVLKFAFLHYPLYSDNPNEATDTFLLGNSSLEGLLKQNGVDIAFTGHSHVYERNLASAAGVINYITGGGGATIGTLGTCTSLDAYAIKFTTTGKGCGSAPTPTSANQVYHFLKVTVNGTNVTVTPINALGQSFDVMSYSFTAGKESTPPSTPAGLTATAASGTQINLSWSAATDNTGVRGYGVYRDGNLIDTVDANTLSYSDTTVGPATSYSYRVDAFDGSANHSALSGPATATTPGTAAYTFVAVADAYVSSGSPTSNFGLTNTIRADASPDFHSYLRFNVGDLSGTVTRATLRLYATSSSATGYQIKRVGSQNWEEASITFSNAPAVGSLLGSSGSFSSNNWTSADVTPLITGNGVYDLALTTTSSSNMNFNSRDAASNPPQLVIETSASPAPTPTPTITNTPAAGANLVLNPGFEVQGSGGTADAADWTEGTNHARASDKFHTGSWALHSTYRGAGTSTRTTAPIAVTPNTTYAYSGYIWRTDTVGGACMDMADLPGETQLCTGVAGSWQFLTGAWNSGSNTSVSLRLVTDGSPTGDIWFDDISLVGPGGTATSTSTSTAAVSTATATLTPSPTGTPAATDTSTPTPTATDTLAASDTPTPTSTPSETLTPTDTFTPTVTPSLTGTPAFTDTPTLTATPTDTPAATDTPSPTGSPTATNTATSTPTATDTSIATDTPTATLTPTPTSSPTATNTATSTSTATETTVVTDTPTFTLTPSPTSSPTLTSTATLTPTFTLAPSNTPTMTSSPTATATPSRTPTATATSGSGSVLTFTAVADARVSESSPTTNFGTATTLLVDGGTGVRQNSFIRFNASGIGGSIQSARLRVFSGTDGTANGPAVYLADNTWTESGTGGVNWSTQPALLSGAFDNKASIPTSTWIEYDVTALVSGDGTYTFGLVADSTDGVNFSAREGANPPQLVVTLGTGTPVPSPTPSRTPTPTATAGATSTPTLTPTATPTSASGNALTFTAVADTKVNEASPTTNYGTATTFLVDGGTGVRQNSFIRFNASGITGTVQSAKLRVFCATDGTTNGPPVSLADNSWTESGTGGVNWNTQPALLSGAFDNKSSIPTGTWVEYDVTALVSGNGTYTFALVADSTDGVNFSSREGSNAPQLVVTFGP